MATTTTYSFEKPTVGGDDGTWGGKLNANWDAVDDLLDGTTPIQSPQISGTISGTAVTQSATDPTTGRLLKVGDFGVGRATDVPNIGANYNVNLSSGIYRGDGAGASNYPGICNYGSVIVSRRGGAAHRLAFIADATIKQLWLTAHDATGAKLGTDASVWHSLNTVVDGSGFIKEASPIVRVYADAIDEPNEPVGAVLTHTATGVYVLSNVEPLASVGWQVGTPSDVNGNKVVTVTTPEYDADARTLTLRTFDLLWHEGRLVPGDPMDIPADYFVMLRFAPDASAN